jgi:hypothetical protein
MPKNLSPTSQNISHPFSHGYNRSLTFISSNPAFDSRSLTHFTAWKGVGEALTKERKSFAAAVILADIVEWFLVRQCLIEVPRSMYITRETVRQGLTGFTELPAGSVQDPSTYIWKLRQVKQVRLVCGSKLECKRGRNPPLLNKPVCHQSFAMKIFPDTIL